jgi:hypothetical protein
MSAPACISKPLSLEITDDNYLRSPHNGNIGPADPPIRGAATQLLVLHIIDRIASVLSSASVKCFIKGGAAAEILLGLKDGFPYPINNDIDVDMLINPHLDGDRFKQTLARTLETLLRELTATLNSSDLIGRVKEEWAVWYAKPSAPCDVAVQKSATRSVEVSAGKGFTPFDFMGDQSFYRLVTGESLSRIFLKDSLFRVVVYPNYFHKDTPLNMVLVRLYPNLARLNGQPLDSVLDFILPKLSTTDEAHNGDLRSQWETTTLVSHTITEPIKDYVSKLDLTDPDSTIIDQQLAVDNNTRAHKREVRDARINSLLKLQGFSRESWNAARKEVDEEEEEAATAVGGARRRSQRRQRRNKTKKIQRGRRISDGRRVR